jgi:hypothetical protein
MDTIANQIGGKRFGLGRDAVFRLWKAALKDDEALLDDMIAASYDRMMRVDPARAEEVMGLVIQRHRSARQAFRDMLDRVKGRVLSTVPAI